MAPHDAAGDAAPFQQVLDAEWKDIRARRATHQLDVGKPTGPPDNLKGLALSGGGIRSATFCLGVLQQLHRRGVLKHFDYLSTVSGGGFVGGWWSAWLARKNGRPRSTGEIFPPEECLETERGKWHQTVTSRVIPEGEEQSEGARSASVDPVHHLRLFANYLTPRKGALSGDTWRAITVVSRNLFLTVLMLVPLLAAGILATQFYFTADPDLVSPYVCGTAPDSTKNGLELAKPGAASQAVCAGTVQAVGQQRQQALVERAVWTALPLLVLVGALVFSLVCWMVFSIGGVKPAVPAIAGVFLIFLLLPGVIDLGTPSLFFVELGKHRVSLLLAIGAVPILVPAVGTLFHGGAGPEVRTNQMTRAQTRILVAFTVLATTLVFGGFAHEVVRYALVETSSRVAKAGGWMAVLWAVAGAIYTGVKASPSGGRETPPENPGKWSILIITVTPILVLGVLLFVVGSGTHAILSGLVVPSSGEVPPLVTAFLVAIAITAYFGAAEFITDDEPERRSRLVRTMVAGAAGALVAIVAGLVVRPLDYDRHYASAFIGLAAGLVLTPWVVEAFTPRPVNGTESVSDRRRRLSPRFFLGSAIVGWTAGFLLGKLVPPHMDPGQGSPLVVALAAGGITFAAVLVLLSARLPGQTNHRMLVLEGFVVLLLGPMLMQQFLNPRVMQVLVPEAIIALIGIVVGSIIGLGWMLDPNYVALHTFYRARLVRAYLGASNPRRQQSDAEITESVREDDIPLRDLADGGRGGPCHLINATLNLVGGRDLTTAQRSADYFTLSRNFCGSLRTGYRPTSEYMSGRLSLGTAVAVSGAAASPNMGSMTPSAALAMLMALLNVRLGFWAPTPNQPRWTSPRPRLWPFYLIREFLSQTNDLSVYCYLTDGGHFDNTGLYSLVQRGCRQILFVDCGADPMPCFSDLGEAIRRCRIDFGSEFELDVEPFATRQPVHFVTGTIRYSARHAADLGWDPKASRKGTIVWIKPARVPGDPADVQQYGRENPVFPQQTTADQWFDEAQFESYRRLGVASATRMLQDPDAVEIFA